MQATIRAVAPPASAVRLRQPRGAASTPEKSRARTADSRPEWPWTKSKMRLRQCEAVAAQDRASGLGTKELQILDRSRVIFAAGRDDPALFDDRIEFIRHRPCAPLWQAIDAFDVRAPDKSNLRVPGL